MILILKIGGTFAANFGSEQFSIERIKRESGATIFLKIFREK